MIVDEHGVFLKRTDDLKDFHGDLWIFDGDFYGFINCCINFP